jgi:hypothetical protein
MPAFMWIDDEQQCFGEFDERPDWALREVPRMPGPFEHWDEEASDFRYDAEGHANAEAGKDHIVEVRIRKAIEASLIVGGWRAPDMLVVKEAELRGVEPEELAQLVLSKVARTDELELDRQAASLTGKIAKRN